MPASQPSRPTFHVSQVSCLWVSHALWEIRVDKPQGDGRVHKRHVHVRHKKIQGQWSWNQDGSRHDAGKFPKSSTHFNKAKEIAAKHLNVEPSTLQFILQTDGPARFSVYTDRIIRSKPEKVHEGYVKAAQLLVMFEDNSGQLRLVYFEDGLP